MIDGTLFVAGTRILYVGPLVATTRHAHHAAQIIVAPQGLYLEDGSRGVRTRAAVIPPMMRHRHGACAHAAVLFLDGDDATSRELARHAEPHCTSWERATLDVHVPRAPAPAQARTLLAALLAEVDARASPRPRHPAVRRMCRHLDHVDRRDLASLARDAGLSPRQMRHAFVRDVGISMRAYLRWKRLRRAASAIESGESLTTAAATAGFADSAHLSRVFRAHFGVMPTQGLGSVTWCTLD